MSLLGNIIWVIFGGFFATIGYFIGGITMCLSIIGIPMGIQSFKIGVAIFAPFGKVSQPNPHFDNLLRLILSVIWLVLFGWVIALVHIIFGVILMITIIGIPFGLQHFKLIPISLMPMNYDLVSKRNNRNYSQS